MTNRPTSKNLGQDQLWYWVASIALYLWLLTCHGFIAYSNDTIETVPYALWLHDSIIFSEDFHIQALSSIIPNERFAIAWMLHFFPNSIWNASIAFHACFSILLILGLLRVTNYFIKDLLWSIIVVVGTLGTSYMINLGGNELYYNMFVSSLAGKAIAIWCLYYFFHKKYIYSSGILGIATFFHPLVGIQLFVLLSWVLLFCEKKKSSTLFSWVLPYSLTGLLWVVIIVFGHQESPTSDFLFSDIIYSRIGHHFYPSLFGIKNYFVLIPLFVFAGWYFFTNEKRIFHIFLAAMIGVIVYLFGITFDVDTVLSTQWFKVTIWLKFFSIIAIVLFIKSFLTKRLYVTIAIILSVAIAYLRFQPTFDQETDQNLYAFIQKNTTVNDLFVLPHEMTDFKAMTRRSSYFDYKAMLHHKPFIYDWADRLDEVYGIKIQSKEYIDGNQLNAKYLSNPKFLSSRDIDYVIVPIDSGANIDWKLVFESKKYKLYKK